jgi:hypothetical protein
MEQRTLFDDPYDYDRRIPVYGGKHSGYSTWDRRVTQPSTVLKPTRKIIVLSQDGTEQTFTVPYDIEGWFDIAAAVWPTVDHVMRIPRDHCTFSYGEPKFNACVYTAANDYMQARWGRKLDDSDRRWLAAHPLSTDGGVPQEYTATCVDQLVTPYGMRVSRVRLRKGSLVLGDSIMAWIQALGCNPFALADRSTTNAEAAERMGISVEQANALWRVEFHDDPLPCSIVGERGWTNSTGVSTGSFGGHARYLAPRGLGGDWFVSIQLDMDTQVQYLVEPPSPEYVPRKGDSTLLVSAVTGPDGKLIAEKVNYKWQPVGAVAAVLPATTMPATTPVSYAPVPKSRFDDDKDFDDAFLRKGQEVCLFCGNDGLRVADLIPEADICFDCLEEAWETFSCPHCKDSFHKIGPPSPLSFDDASYDWQCPSCKGEIAVGVDSGETKAEYMLAELSYSVFHNAALQTPVNDDIPANWID